MTQSTKLFLSSSSTVGWTGTPDSKAQRSSLQHHSRRRYALLSGGSDGCRGFTQGPVTMAIRHCELTTPSFMALASLHSMFTSSQHEKPRFDSSAFNVAATSIAMAFRLVWLMKKSHLPGGLRNFGGLERSGGGGLSANAEAPAPPW